MPLTAQVRLLRVLETGEFSRVGSSAVLKSDVRIIVATNKDLAREVARGRFREDLYYRISTVILQIPPLRDRKEDILPIFSSFQHRFTQKYNSTLKRLDDSARELLQNYRWPGNARELRNVAEQMVVLNKSDVITVDDIRSYLRGTIASGPELGLMPVPHETMGDGADSRERELIYRTLLELRTEIHWLKEKIIEMTGRPKAPWEESSEAEPSRYMIVRDENSDPVPSLIEDAAFEIEGAGAPEGSVEDHVSKAAENGELPTLEAAERKLIEEALERFDGNRRQTAQALGISERTLYRKIKEFEGEDA